RLPVGLRQNPAGRGKRGVPHGDRAHHAPPRGAPRHGGALRLGLGEGCACRKRQRHGKEKAQPARHHDVLLDVRPPPVSRSAYLICSRRCAAPETSALPGSGSMLSSLTTPSTTSI